MPLTGIRPPLRTQTAAATHPSPTLLRRSVSQEAFSCQHSSEPLSQQQDGSSGQPPHGSGRDGTAPLREEPGRPRAPWARLNGAAERGAPCPHGQRDRHGNSSLAPNGPGWRPRSCSGKFMHVGRRRSGAEPRLSAARGETLLSPCTVPLSPRRPASPQPAFRRGSANGPSVQLSARARPRPRAHLPRSSQPAPVTATRIQRRSVGTRRRPVFIGPAARPAPPAPPPRGRAARGARGEVPPGPAPLRWTARRAAWPARPRRPWQRGDVGLRGGTAACVPSPWALPRCIG